MNARCKVELAVPNPAAVEHEAPEVRNGSFAENSRSLPVAYSLNQSFNSAQLYVICAASIPAAPHTRGRP